MITQPRTDARNDLRGFTAADYFASHTRHSYRVPKNRRVLSPRQQEVFAEAMLRVRNGENIKAVEAWVRKVVAK